MRLSTLFVLSIVFAPTAQGQDAGNASGKNVDPGGDQLVEKIRKLQPPKWTYSKLAAESDLIVVAKAVSISEIEWDGAFDGEFDGKLVKCFSNKMRVLSTLKGRTGDEIEVVTIEWRSDVIVLTNFDFSEIRTSLLLPSLVRVEVDGAVVGYGESHSMKTYKIEPEYLLYLRRLNGERYVPVTGQRYSGLSARTLNN